jgi:hypothetical protein
VRVINREKRAIAKQMVESFAAGTITSDEMDNDFPRDKNDPALGGIWERLWFLWDDFHDHTLTGKYAPSLVERAMMERCIAFLESDLEYEWPSLIGSLKLILLRLFRFRKKAGEVEKREIERAREIRSSRSLALPKKGRLGASSELKVAREEPTAA